MDRIKPIRCVEDVIQVSLGFFTVPPQAEGSSRTGILMGAFVAFGGILFGYDKGTIGGILAMGE